MRWSRTGREGGQMSAETERSIAANGLQIHYRESGRGQPLVLLHGGTATSGSWSPHVPTFAERFRVLAPDSRGHGKTDNPLGQLTYALMAQDVAGFVEALALEKPLVLGYSDGGQIALELAIRYPHLAAGLVIGGASFKFGHTYFQGLKSWGFGSAADVNGDTLQRTNPDYLSYLKREHARPDHPDHWQTLLEQIGDLWFSVTDYTEEQLRGIRTPTMLFLGDRDELNDINQQVEMYHHIGDAELAVVPHADHFSAVDDMSNPMVLRFLERHPQVSPTTTPIAPASATTGESNRLP
jgi:pimeloyl-ACP methyl ester carboxylesterase